jgi:hemoglobin
MNRGQMNRGQMNRGMILMSVLAIVAAAACGGQAKATESVAALEPTASLYDRLGGKDAITAVVKDFVEERVGKDARINAFFAKTDLKDLQIKMVDQICEATGGPCKYLGKDMRTAHMGMGVKETDFTALVEDLKASLDHFKVPQREQGELIAKLATMHDDVVDVK